MGTDGGKTVLVTGGSRGWGEAIVLRFAQPGTEVVISYVANTESAERVAALAREQGAGASTIRADVGTEEGIGVLMDHVKNRADRLDVLVHNAFAQLNGRPSDVESDVLTRAWMVGPVACNRLIQESLPLFPNGTGRVVLTGSTGTRRTFSKKGTGYFPMALAKAAEETLVRYWAVELGDRGITVNMVVAGWIGTEFVKSKIPDSVREGINAATPLGRLATPGELAEVVAFLGSPVSSWVTGQILTADGGLTLI